MLKTKDGVKVFDEVVIETTVENVELHKEGKDIFAYHDGDQVGRVVSDKVVADGKSVKVSDLISEISGKDLVGKNPLEMTPEELAIYTEYLQELAQQKAAPKKKSKEAEKKVEEKVEEETEAPGEPLSLKELKALAVKDLWKDVIQPIADKLDGITSRSKKNDMIEAYLKYFQDDEDIEEEVEEAPKKSKKKAPEPEVEEIEEEDDELDEDDSDDDGDDDEEDDDDELDEEEDELDDEDEEDEEDEYDDDEDEDEDDEDDEEEDDEDEEDDEEEELTAADIDALSTKEQILDVITRYNIDIPKKGLTVAKVKQYIKDALGLEDEDDEEDED